MSTVDITGLLANSSTATSNTSNDGLAGVTGADFMNILIKQLEMQDPFKPMTNQEMIQQLSSIRELEMNTRMSDKLQQLTDQQRFGSAAALIGKQVSGMVTDSGGTPFMLQGVVTSIRFTNTGNVMLDLDSGQSLPIASLQTVQDAAQSTTSTKAQNTARTIVDELLSSSVSQPLTANVNSLGIPLSVGVSASGSQPISTTRSTSSTNSTTSSALQRALNNLGI